MKNWKEEKEQVIDLFFTLVAVTATTSIIVGLVILSCSTVKP